MDKLGGNLPIWWVKMENNSPSTPPMEKKISKTFLERLPKDHPYFWMAYSLSCLGWGGVLP